MKPLSARLWIYKVPTIFLHFPAKYAMIILMMYNTLKIKENMVIKI